MHIKKKFKLIPNLCCFINQLYSILEANIKLVTLNIYSVSDSFSDTLVCTYWICVLHSTSIVCKVNARSTEFIHIVTMYLFPLYNILLFLTLNKQINDYVSL